MSEIEIKREDGETGGRYVTRVNGHEAEMTYSKAGTERIIIDHTGVPKELGGLGAVSYTHLTLPTTPYV